jgi:hypothetical protein
MGNRRFPMEAALLHWLGPYRKEEGLLIPMVDSAVRRRMKKLRLASKVNPPTNALRHSYASYWLARSSKEGLGELSKRMGNSEAVCKRHYLETLTREEGAAWFKIRDSKASAEELAPASAAAEPQINSTERHRPCEIMITVAFMRPSPSLLELSKSRVLRGRPTEFLFMLGCSSTLY